MGTRAHYSAIPATLAAEAGTSFEAWRRAFDSVGVPGFSLGKEYRHLWDWLSPHLDAVAQDYALGRAIYGTRKLYTLEGPAPHAYEESVERARLVPPDDVAAAAAWMNVMDRTNLLWRRASKPDGWQPTPEVAERIWGLFRDFRQFYTETAIRGDAVVAYIG